MDRKDGSFLDVPVKLAWLLYSNIKAAPLPLLGLVLLTSVLSFLTVVCLP